MGDSSSSNNNSNKFTPTKLFTSPKMAPEHSAAFVLKQLQSCDVTNPSTTSSSAAAATATAAVAASVDDDVIDQSDDVTELVGALKIGASASAEKQLVNGNA